MFNKNYIIISSIDWETHSQLHHALTKHLLNTGKKVLFIENTGSRSLRLGDIERVKQRMKNLFRSKGGFTNISKNLTIYTPIFIPFHFNIFLKNINNFLVVETILKWMRNIKFDDPVIINFIPNPITQNLIKCIDSSAKIYFMADNMTLNYKNQKLIKKCELDIMKNSDYIFYTSELLKNKFNNLKIKNEILSSGVDFKKFNLKKVINKKFIIGYIGAIRPLIDEILLLNIANKFPECEIRLVGPELINFQRLKKHNNIKFFGQINHRLIPKMLSTFNVGIIPYKVNKFTNSIYPLKLNEYLAAGLPVVSTNLKTILKFDEENSNIINIAKDKYDFIKILEKIKLKKINIDKKKLKLIARSNTWKNKFERFDEIIEYILFEKNFQKKKLAEKLINFYNKKKYFYLKIILLSLSIYVFYKILIFTELLLIK
jgi:teichuronic acid biosynthesis glycosyltransferase TuaH